MFQMRKKVRWQLLLVLGAFFFSMMFAPSKNAQELPDPTSEFYVYDPSGTLSEETKTFIMSVNEQYELTEEKPQVVVAVVDSLEGETIEEYSVDLFEKWKIGQADADNGVLILLALEEREIRFEIGYGLEGALTDSRTGRILDNHLEYLSANDFDGGLKEIFTEAAVVINQEYQYDDEVIFSGYPVNTTQYVEDDSSFFASLIQFLFILLLLSFFLVAEAVAVDVVVE